MFFMIQQSNVLLSPSKKMFCSSIFCENFWYFHIIPGALISLIIVHKSWVFLFDMPSICDKAVSKSWYPFSCHSSGRLSFYHSCLFLRITVIVAQNQQHQNRCFIILLPQCSLVHFLCFSFFWKIHRPSSSVAINEEDSRVLQTIHSKSPNPFVGYESLLSSWLWKTVQAPLCASASRRVSILANILLCKFMIAFIFRTIFPYLRTYIFLRLLLFGILSTKILWSWIFRDLLQVSIF